MNTFIIEPNLNYAISDYFQIFNSLFPNNQTYYQMLDYKILTLETHINIAVNKQTRP
jgi:hypothetical protein